MGMRTLSERDVCSKFIAPALSRAGWDEMLQIREEVSFTKGRIIVRGKLVSRGQCKRADYILYYKPNIPIAVVEAKDAIRLRFVIDHTDPHFINLAMNAPGFRRSQIAPYIKQQTGQANVNGTAMKNMLIALPPVEEQHRIVAKVDELMGLCDRLEANLAAGDEARQRLLKANLHDALEPAEARELEFA